MRVQKGCWRWNNSRNFIICKLAIQQLWTWFLWYFAPFRVPSSCSYIQQLLSVSLSGSTSGFCMHWCARANTQLHYATFMSWSPPFPPHPKPNSACRYCYTTGKKSDDEKWALFAYTSIMAALDGLSLHFIRASLVTSRCALRCLIEAWSLIRQHSTRLNMDELLGFLYESCQELNLIKELLKLPLGLSEQVGDREHRADVMTPMFVSIDLYPFLKKMNPFFNFNPCFCVQIMKLVP